MPPIARFTDQRVVRQQETDYLYVALHPWLARPLPPDPQVRRFRHREVREMARTWEEKALRGWKLPRRVR